MRDHGMAMSIWTVESLKQLMDERDKRWSVEMECAKEAVKLAKDAADSSQGKVNLMSIVAVVSIVLSAISLFVGVK